MTQPVKVQWLDDSDVFPHTVWEAGDRGVMHSQTLDSFVGYLRDGTIVLEFQSLNKALAWLQEIS